MKNKGNSANLNNSREKIKANLKNQEEHSKTKPQSFKINYVLKMTIWILSALLVISIGFNVFQLIKVKEKYFVSNLGEEITFNIKSGVNTCSVYYPDSVVSNVEYRQPLNIVLMGNISSIKMKFEGMVNNENKNEVSISLDDKWEQSGDYYVFVGDILENSQFAVVPKITLPESISNKNGLNIITITIIANWWKIKILIVKNFVIFCKFDIISIYLYR